MTPLAFAKPYWGQSTKESGGFAGPNSLPFIGSFLAPRCLSLFPSSRPLVADVRLKIGFNPPRPGVPNTIPARTLPPPLIPCCRSRAYDKLATGIRKVLCIGVVMFEYAVTRSSRWLLALFAQPTGLRDRNHQAWHGLEGATRQRSNSMTPSKAGDQIRMAVRPPTS
jgi:hypothetical protein